MLSLTASEVILFVLGQLIVAAGIWGGIRADLRNMHEKIKNADDNADDAHERIDSIMSANYQETHINRRASQRRREGPQ